MKKGKKGERKGGRRGRREKQRNRKRNRKKSITKNRKRDRKRNGKRKPALPLLLAPTGITPSPSLGPWLPCFQSLSSHLSSNLALPIGSPRGFPAHPARNQDPAAFPFLSSSSKPPHSMLRHSLSGKKGAGSHFQSTRNPFIENQSIPGRDLAHEAAGTDTPQNHRIPLLPAPDAPGRNAMAPRLSGARP